MASHVPSSRHLANRAYADCRGPYDSRSSRHCAPLRAIQSIPLSIIRSSFRGRPRFPVLSGGSIAFMRSHCSFVNLNWRGYFGQFFWKIQNTLADFMSGNNHFLPIIEKWCIFFGTTVQMDIGRTPIISKAALPSWCGSDVSRIKN